MSIIETIKGRGKAPGQADILTNIANAEAELAELERQHGPASLAAVEQVPNAAIELEALNRKIAIARERVKTLQAAHRAAIQRNEAALAADRAAIQKSQIAAVRKHLEARDAALVAFAAKMAEATAHYHEMIDRSLKAQNACPIGMAWPDGSLCEPHMIRGLASGEFYRISATPGNADARSLPGSRAPNPDFDHNPSAIAPLVDTIKHASAYVIAKLMGKAE